MSEKLRCENVTANELLLLKFIPKTSYMLMGNLSGYLVHTIFSVSSQISILLHSSFIANLSQVVLLHLVLSNHP